jgi:hypothetical protein
MVNLQRMHLRLLLILRPAFVYLCAIFGHLFFYLCRYWGLLNFIVF